MGRDHVYICMCIFVCYIYTDFLLEGQKRMIWMDLSDDAWLGGRGSIDGIRGKGGGIETGDNRSSQSGPVCVCVFDMIKWNDEPEDMGDLT